MFSTGTMKYNGQIYATPTAAGKAIITQGTINGWKLWKYNNKSGELVYLSELTK